MGYKFKATMYYSDSETEQFLKNREEKTNGKGSISQYMYSLVTKEREKNVVIELNHDDSGVVTMHPQYTSVLWREINGVISFTSIYSVKENKVAQKRVKHKGVMREIDMVIEKDINSMSIVRRSNLIDSECFFIVIKSRITCFYSDEIKTDEYVQGNFSATIGLIRVNRSEWERWGGRYDFENITYIKFAGISNPNENKLKGLCQVAEQKMGYTAGAFFIPVRKTAIKFPLEKKSQSVIIGVDINFSQDRVKFKKMNKSQKERYFKKTLDCNF
ncbi:MULTISPECIES: hypothetical protein [unclassified Cedecea]|uniref:hypothetical protein n=1 Tax=unclassified Cedecea TaxID=2649846 RepID=UPI0030169271